MARRHIEIAQRLGQAACCIERRALVAEWARTYDVSAATIYRWAARGGWASSRARRRDAGQPRCGLTDQDLDLVAGVVRHSQRADGRIAAPVNAVVSTLQAGGHLPAEVSASTVCRLLRDRPQPIENCQLLGCSAKYRCTP